MIVISGALVLVALVLLIIGLVSTSLGFVYASIAVSVVSFVFLLIGILQRRGEQVPETASGVAPAPPVPAGVGADAEGVTAILPSSRPSEATAAATEAEAPAAVAAAAPASSAEVSGSVLVVPGRPRYHVAGCRYLTGKDPEAVDVQTAREDKYTACGVCKPDESLAEAAAGEAEVLPPAAAIVAAEEATEAAPDPVEAARKTTRATATTSPGRTPAKKAATKAPAKAAKKAPAKAAAGAAAGTGSVVVIPDRGKFHKADCRFVRDASDTKEMTRAAAARGGYAACGVCKP